MPETLLTSMKCQSYKEGRVVLKRSLALCSFWKYKVPLLAVKHQYPVAVPPVKPTKPPEFSNKYTHKDI